MKKIVLVILLSFGVISCSSKQATIGYKPAINVGIKGRSSVAQYVPVPMPGQMMPAPGKSIKLTRLGKRSHNLSGIAAVRNANKKAKHKPNSSKYINSIMTYNYMRGALYQIYCAPLGVTDVQFQVGEHIISSAAGDTLRWQVSKTYSGSNENRIEHLLIKPIESDISNSLVITTNFRTYHLMLHATHSTYMASVQWRYSQYEGDGGMVRNFSNDNGVNSTIQSVRNLNIDKLDFDYELSAINGNQPKWMPTMVFNDGHKTYIKFQRSLQDSPTLFIGGIENNERVVNYRVEGDYYIIDRVIDQAQLRLGQTDPVVVQISHT